MRSEPLTIGIRFPHSADAAKLAEAVQESLDDLLPWMVWVTPDYDEDQAKEWITGRGEERARGAGFDFLICDSVGGILGVCGLNQIHPEHRLANVGYWVRSSSAGRGVAVEAVKQLRDWAFAHTDLQRLEILVATGNTRSERVAEKVEATREGVLRSRLHIRGANVDATMFSLVRGRERA